MMLRSPEVLAATAQLNPEIEAVGTSTNPCPSRAIPLTSEIQFAKIALSPADPSSHAPDPYDYLSIRATMQNLEAANLAASKAHPESIHESTHVIHTRDNHPLEMKIHRPLHPPSGTGSPLIVLVYGGGFVSGSMHQFTPLARLLVRLYASVVVTTSHRQAPGHPFPTPWLDTWGSVVHLSHHATSAPFHADPSAGSSSAAAAPEPKWPLP